MTTDATKANAKTRAISLLEEVNLASTREGKQNVIALALINFKEGVEVETPAAGAAIGAGDQSGAPKTVETPVDEKPEEKAAEGSDSSENTQSPPPPEVPGDAPPARPIRRIVGVATRHPVPGASRPGGTRLPECATPIPLPTRAFVAHIPRLARIPGIGPERRPSGRCGMA